MTVTKIPVAINDREVSLISYGLVGNGDLTIHVNNLTTGNRELAWLNKAGSDALIAALTAHFGAPEPVTFHSEFAKLEVGDEFIVRDGPNDPRPWPSVKLSDTEYYEDSYKKRRHIQWASATWTITKN